jgi:hypothetical protein
MSKKIHYLTGCLSAAENLYADAVSGQLRFYDVKSFPAGIIPDGYLDKCSSVAVGITGIKQRRLTQNFLASRPGLKVGDCVPFYFCPRSIMLYLIHQANHPELDYRGGQEPVIHLEFDLRAGVEWAEALSRQWAFTLSNAGSSYFEDRADLARLGEINWLAVATDQWSGPGVDRSIKEGKQAEFLVEESFPWALVERIGVRSRAVYQRVATLMTGNPHRPRLEILPHWYY